MFNFFGKKNELKEPKQPAGLSEKGLTPTSTKVEDDMASFEIPDFTEDDLNFDLGINEFMPESETRQQPLVSPKVVPSSDFVQPNQMQQPASQSEPSMQPKSNMPSMAEQEEMGMGIDSSDDIPKFNLDAEASIPAVENKTAPVKTEQKRKNQRENSIPAIKTSKPYGYSSDGIFISEEEYKKTVILVDDTIRKAERAESIKTNSFDLSDSKKQQVEKLSKVLKSITETIMDMDAKLFEQGGAK